MKANALAGLLFTLMTSGAAASACGPVAEYAQYKDNARTKAGRDGLVANFCLYSRMQAIGGPAREMDECAANKSKIADALRAANDEKSIVRALGGCPEIFGPKPKEAPIYKCQDANGLTIFSHSACDAQGMRTLSVMQPP